MADWPGATIGDGVAQLLSGQPFNLKRNIRFALFGLAFSGPSGHWWHNFLDTVIMPQHPTCTAAVFMKLFFDQLVFAPMASLLCLSFLKVAEGDLELVVPFVKVRCRVPTQRFPPARICMCEATQPSSPPAA